MTKTKDDHASFELGLGLAGNLDTLYIPIDPATDPEQLEASLRPAADILKAGGLVAFPTETVYGLGANALSPDAVRKIYQAKGRPSDNPMIVHVSTIDEIKSLVAGWSELADLIARRFMPGPLTLVLKKTDRISDVVSGGLDTIGMRIPENLVARYLIRLAGVPVAAPSANRSGRPSPTEATHVLSDLKGRIDCVVDGGSTTLGLESTVLDLTSAKGPRILRPGGVSFEALAQFLEEIGFPHDKSDDSWRLWLEGESNIDFPAGNNPQDIPKSPGMKYRHYAPRASVYLLEGDMKQGWNHILVRHAGAKVALYASEELRELLDPGQDIVLRVFGRKDQADLAAHDLFSALRDFDDKACDIIVVETIDLSELGRAYMNRLTKAASFIVNGDQIRDLRS